MVALNEFVKLHKKRVKANMSKTLKALFWLTALSCILVVGPCLDSANIVSKFVSKET